MDHDELDRFAVWVLDSLADVPAVAVELLAGALRLSGGPLARFSPAFESVAIDGSPSDIARIQLRRALRLVSADELDELVGRLDGVEAAPWPQIRAALVAVRETREER
jgi:hypothetical protein